VLPGFEPLPDYAGVEPATAVLVFIVTAVLAALGAAWWPS
jgi:hypothetical protein